MTFSGPIKKEVTNTDKDGHESVATISYKIKLIDSAGFMATLFSNLVHNNCDCFLERKVSRTIR